MRIALLGGAGRMGQAIKELAECDDFAGPASGTARDTDVLIDFSSPEGTVEAALYCQSMQLPLVTGTTGLDDEQQATVREASSVVPIVQSGNMSLGVTMLKRLVAEAAEALQGFDIEILETHHRHKKDSPSGTALLLGEAAARGRGTTLSERAKFSRHGREETRHPDEIGFAVRRGGGVYGEHDVSFMSEGETVTLSHQALSRDAFARGALTAAKWVISQPPGLYGMDDVLA
ncbi:MAG: 4-hydroxy-tetrahydrodipicolinate reductase [Pseudomonadota bacterium]